MDESKSIELQDAKIRDSILEKFRGEKKLWWRDEKNQWEINFKNPEFIKDINPNPFVVENEINYLIDDGSLLEGTAPFLFLSKKGKSIIADISNRGYLAKRKQEHYLISLSEQTKSLSEKTLSISAINTTWVVIGAAAAILTLLYELLK